MILSGYIGETILAIGAHPDDVEIGAGGLCARLSQKGARVVVAVVSVPSDLERRISEARRAAEILGYEIRFLRATRCSRVEDLKSYELTSMIDDLVRELRPALVLAHGEAEYHTDHVLVHKCCLASQRLHPFDMLCFHPPACRPVPATFHPHVFVDITATMELKMAAIEAHRSQFAERGISTEMYRDIARLNGRMIGVPYAEGLEVERIKLM